MPHPATLRRLSAALGLAPSPLLRLRLAVVSAGDHLRASMARPGRADVDPLTGLAGPRWLERSARALLRDIECNPAKRAAGFLIGLDGFARINDALGRQAGDRVLVDFARRLETAARPAALVARVGGDVFAVLTSGPTEQDEVRDLAHRLLAAVAAPVAIEGLEVVVTASAGAVLLPEHGGDPATLLQHAERALREAKATGGNRALVYAPQWDATARQRLALEEDLREELRGGRSQGLRVYYQPVAALPALRVVGAEALARWQHPGRGLLAPAAFIPEAERSGLVLPLGAWVLGAAVRQASRWRAAELGDLAVAVNVSARQLAEEDLCGLVARTLAETGLPARLLELELTESAPLSDLDRAAAILRAVREMGVRVALDDFGTGFSSLAYLRSLPIDTVKLDRTFVVGLAGDRAARATVAAVVELARGQGLAVVAEGVETEDELDVVRELGCDAAQGYLFGAPLPAEEFESTVGADRSLLLPV